MLFVTGTAFADRVSALIVNLETGKAPKHRLAAGLALIKIRDQRAVTPMTKALAHDPDKNVRAIAALGLGKLIGARTATADKAAAIAVLGRAAQRDPAPPVRRAAASSLTTINAGGTASGGGSAAGVAPPPANIYVNVGPMSDNSNSGVSRAPLMRQTVERAILKNAGWMTSWPGGAVPTAAQLSAQGMTGYHVAATLTSLRVQRKQASTIVSCRLSVLLAAYPTNNTLQTFGAGASVHAGTTSQNVAAAQDDCVAAVLVDVVGKFPATIARQGASATGNAAPAGGSASGGNPTGNGPSGSGATGGNAGSGAAEANSE